MALQSSWVKVSTAKVEQAKFTIPSTTVTANSPVVNPKAIEHYNSIRTHYTNIAKDFDKLAVGFKDLTNCCAKKAKGLRKSLTTISKKCSEQAGYCRNRKKEAENLFDYASLEAKIAELEKLIVK